MSRKNQILVVTALVICVGAGCANSPEGGEDPDLRVVGKPEVILDGLHYPAAPRLVDGELIFAEGGKGTIYGLRQGRKTPLIEGFGVDDYLGYEISVLGLEVLADGTWLVAAAEGDGKFYIFDEAKLPTRAAYGVEMEIDDSEPLNPFDILVAGGGGIVVASGGTAKGYQAELDVVNPAPLRPVVEVSTGLAGLTVDPRTGQVYAAVTGSGKDDGSVIRWDPTAEVIQPETVATGFHNLVDVAFAGEGQLLALEFGPFGAANSGRLSIIDRQGEVRSFIDGLDAPSGLHLDPSGRLLITTFGQQGTESGRLLSFKLSSRGEARYER